MTAAGSGDLTLAADLAAAIVAVPDFPRPGVSFKDIVPVLGDAALFRRCVTAIMVRWKDAGITHVLAIESRGFILGAPVAVALQVPFVPLRKPGKLPSQILREVYDLEYGQSELQLPLAALRPGARVLVVDDVLATGGTAAAAVRLAERAGAAVAGVAVLVDLSFLPWRERLAGRTVQALVRY